MFIINSQCDYKNALKVIQKILEEVNKMKKSKVTKEDTGFNIAGVEGEHDRVTGEAGLQIARMKYLAKYK